jgi:hypothetical protein
MKTRIKTQISIAQDALETAKTYATHLDGGDAIESDIATLQAAIYAFNLKHFGFASFGHN